MGVESRVNGALLVSFLSPPGQRHDRHVLTKGLLPDATARRVAIHAGHPDVQKDDVRRERCCATDALECVGRRLCFRAHGAHQGRWAPFIARRNVATDFSSDGGAALVLHLAVVCAEDYPRLTPALQAEDSKNSFLAGVKSERLLELCKVINVPPATWREPSSIAAPALLLSGALDPVTPPRRAQAAARYMPQAQHLIVANAGHGISSLGCTPRLIREFLDNPDQPVQAKCLADIRAATFQLGSAGPHP